MTTTFGDDTAWTAFVEAASAMCALADAGLCIVQHGDEATPTVVVVQELGLLARGREEQVGAGTAGAASTRGASIIQAVSESREPDPPDGPPPPRAFGAVRWSAARALVIDTSGRGHDVYRWARREVARFRELDRADGALDALGEGIVIVDDAGRIDLCTRRAAALIDPRLTPEDIESRGARDVLSCAHFPLEPNEVRRGSLAGEEEVSYVAHHPAPRIGEQHTRPGLVLHLRAASRFVESRKGQLALLSALRHDVRSPLTALRGLVGILLEEPDMPRAERQTLLSLLQQEAERTVTWVEDYLILLRLRFEPRPSNPVPMAADALLDALESHFADHARERGVELSIARPASASGGQGEVSVHGETTLVDAFCKNLVGHFLRLADGGASVSVRIGARGALEVEGHGPGLFAQHPKHPFTTLARSTAGGKRTPGVGLGLFLAKKVADVHGWPIAITADDGVVRATVDWAGKPAAAAR